MGKEDKIKTILDDVDMIVLKQRKIEELFSETEMLLTELKHHSRSLMRKVAKLFDDAENEEELVLKDKTSKLTTEIVKIEKTLWQIKVLLKDALKIRWA